MRQTIKQFIIALGEYAFLVYQTIVVCLRRPPAWNLIRTQLYNVGVLSLPVVAFTGLSTGMVLAAQSIFQLSDKGLAGATGVMVAKAMMTELGPVLTAMMVTGRVGAAMCAELGTMRVTEQIDAMRSMATNPLRYLVGPRFIAGVGMLPLLAIFSTVMGIIGGYMVAVSYYGMTPASFLDPMPANLTYYDFFSGWIKSFVFGTLIVTISCYKGMITRGGAAGVGSSTTNSVVICYSAILIVNFIMTVGMNSAYGYFME